ncbi:MAG TPA: HEAT repeat domain-containing protein [Ktedonobacterales bacterium]|nr:HEAT repeat domain-containing protein [Ktedonobacterales bacterium]
MFPSTPRTPGARDAGDSFATLSQLKTQAKALLKAFRADDPQARARIAAQLPRFMQPTSTAHPTRRFALSDALHVIARERGFCSWPRLKAQAEAQARGGPTSDAPRDATPLATRQTAHVSGAHERVAQVAARIVELALGGQTAPLAQLVTSTPRYETLAIRDLIVARGEQAIVVDALLTGLRHDDSRIRFDCAHALDHYADDRCSGPLRLLLADPVPRVRRMALHSLSCDACKVAPLPMGADTDDAEDHDLVALVVAHALGDPSVNVRRHATIALGACCGDPRALGALETLLVTERDPAILRNARWALRRPKDATPTQRS